MTEKKDRILVRELSHQERAFEFYYSLGTQRSYEKVATKFGVSLSTTKLWGRSFGWKERIRKRDIEIAREVASRTLNDEVSRRQRNLKIVELALIEIARAITERRIKFTLTDLDKLIRLESFLNDLPDARTEIVVADLKNKSNEELREMMREEIEILKELEAKEREIEQWTKEGSSLTQS